MTEIQMAGVRRQRMVKVSVPSTFAKFLYIYTQKMWNRNPLINMGCDPKTIQAEKSHKKTDSFQEKEGE